MAVARLSGAWVRKVLVETYPEGVVRRALLDHFAVLLVSKRSSKGAKGRLARRLYGVLLKLQRRGVISQEGGIVRFMAAPEKAESLVAPELTVPLERKLFRALLAEDGQGDGHTPGALREARWEFLAGAIEAGWSMDQAASMLGIKPVQAASILSARYRQRCIRAFSTSRSYGCWRRLVSSPNLIHQVGSQLASVAPRCARPAGAMAPRRAAERGAGAPSQLRFSPLPERASSEAEGRPLCPAPPADHR